jgi:phytoene dehydrogenase-like protein
MDTAQTMWDVICVGSGITALAFGAQMALRHPERKVLILEKHSVPGGYATTFARRGTRFDCSLHKLSGLDNGGNLGRIFRELRLVDDLEVTRSEAHFDAFHNGELLRLSSDCFDTLKSRLLARFPHESEALGVFFREVEVHGRNGYLQFEILKGAYTPEVEDLRYARKELRPFTVAEAFERRFRDPLLRETLASPVVYVGGFPEDVGYPYYLHLLYATLVCGNSYVRGGSQALSDALVRRIRAAGGDVRLRTEVTRVLLDGDRACGVETTAGTFLGRAVYFNAAPQFALERLLPPLPQLETVKVKVADLRTSYSTTTVYLRTDVPPEELGLNASETMVLSPDLDCGKARRARWLSTGNEADAEDAFWLGGPLEATNYHLLDSGGGHVLCLNVLDTMDQWPQRRTPEYKRKKARALNALVGRLEQAAPGLRRHIVYAEVASPHTYQRYTHNHKGAGYGALVGKDARAHLFHYDFPIKGVRFLSAWVAGPTYEAAFGYAEMMAQSYQCA